VALESQSLQVGSRAGWKTLSSCELTTSHGRTFAVGSGGACASRCSSLSRTTYPAGISAYDWDTNKLAEWHDIPVGGTLIVEGVSSLRDELGKYWDFAIWLDCSHEIRLARGVARDGESMRSQWTDIWMPEEDEYFTTQRPDRKADLIIDGTSAYEI